MAWFNVMFMPISKLAVKFLRFCPVLNKSRVSHLFWAPKLVSGVFYHIAVNISISHRSFMVPWSCEMFAMISASDAVLHDLWRRVTSCCQLRVQFQADADFQFGSRNRRRLLSCGRRTWEKKPECFDSFQTRGLMWTSDFANNFVLENNNRLQSLCFIFQVAASPTTFYSPRPLYILWCRLLLGTAIYAFSTLAHFLSGYI